MDVTDPLQIAGRTFASRLIAGTGKFASGKAMAETVEACGAELVTVALRRVDLDASAGEDILDFLDTSRLLLMPNTSGAADADEVVRLAQLARAAEIADEFGRTRIKVEVWAEQHRMLPDPL